MTVRASPARRSPSAASPPASTPGARGRAAAAAARASARPASACQRSSGGRGRGDRARRRRAPSRNARAAARVGEAPGAPAAVPGAQRRRRARLDPDGAERHADADAAADLVLLEPGDDRAAVGPQRELPLAVPADAHDRDVDRRVLALAALARQARREARGGGVRGPADVAADDADAGPDGRHDAVADARHGRRDGGRAREQRTGHEQDATYSAAAWPPVASDAGHTRS